jgi:quercetin dioxygenase-like cupin family protein
MSASMDKQQKLAQVSRDLAEAIRSMRFEVVQYDNGEGIAAGLKLLHTPKVTVQTLHVPVGQEFKPHAQGRRNYIIIFQGSVIVGEEPKSEGELVVIPPDTEKVIKAVDDCWIIGVTVPASPVSGGL